MCPAAGTATVVVMRIRRPVDEHLARLSVLTGVTRRADLIELGRLVDDVLDVPPGVPVLEDWIGARYALAVVGGAVDAGRQGRRVAGEVFMSDPYDVVSSRGAIVLVAAATAFDRLRQLLGRPTEQQPSPRPMPAPRLVTR